MEAQLVAALLADSGLAAVVGDRIWWDKRRQGETRPCIVLYHVSTLIEWDNDGMENLPGRLVRSHAIANTFAGAIAARDALLTAASRLTEPPLQVFVENIFGLPFETGGGPDPQGSSDLFLKVQDLRVWAPAF